jgi:predicted MFS family arabinose efflux permease
LVRASGQIRDSLRYAWTSQRLRVTLLLLFVLSMFSFNWSVLLPLMATRALGGNESSYAFLATFLGCGSFVGTLVVARRHSIDEHFLVRTSLAFGAITVLLALAPNIAVASIVTLFWGGTTFAFIAGAQTFLQLGAEPGMSGRVMALFGVVCIGVLPFGSLLSGWMADEFGTRWALGFGGAAAVLAGGAAFLAIRRRGITHRSMAAAPTATLDVA